MRTKFDYDGILGKPGDHKGRRIVFTYRPLKALSEPRHAEVESRLKMMGMRDNGQIRDYVIAKNGSEITMTLTAKFDRKWFMHDISHRLITLERVK